MAIAQQAWLVRYKGERLRKTCYNHEKSLQPEERENDATVANAVAVAIVADGVATRWSRLARVTDAGARRTSLLLRPWVNSSSA